MQRALEHARVVDRRAGDDLLDGPEAVDEAIVLPLRARVVVANQRRDADRAALQREGAWDRCVGTDDARHRQRDRLDPAHVVAWVVAVVQPFGDRERRGAAGFEAQQGERVELAQRDVARQLELALVVLEVGHLHPLDVELERLAGEQALAAAVPVVERDEVRRVELRAPQLELHRPLGLARRVEREAVPLVVEP